MEIAVAILLIVIACGLLFQGASELRDNRRFPPPGRMVHVDGHRIHLLEQGQGSPTVVLEAGGGNFSLHWSLVQSEFAKFTRVCSYDRAGLGWSALGPKPRTIARLAEELHSLLERAELRGPFVMVAHSLGGSIVVEFANRHPEAVCAIVFVDAAYPELYERFASEYPQWWRRIRRSRLLLMGTSIASWVGLPRLVRLEMNKALPDYARSAAFGLMRRPKFFRTLVHEIDGLLSLRGTKPTPLPRRDLPVTVLVHGKPGMFRESEAEELWLAMQRKLSAHFDRSVFTVVPEANHFIHVQEPASVIEAIREVVKRGRADLAARDS